MKWNSATVYFIASAVFSVHCCLSAVYRKSHSTLAQCAVHCSVQCVEHLTLSWTLIFHSTDLPSWPTFQWLSSFSCTLHISKTKVIHKYKKKQIHKYTNTKNTNISLHRSLISAFGPGRPLGKKFGSSLRKKRWKWLKVVALVAGHTVHHHPLSRSVSSINRVNSILTRIKRKSLFS